MRQHSPSPAAPTPGGLHEVGGRRLPPRLEMLLTIRSREDATEACEESDQ